MPSLVVVFVNIVLRRVMAICVAVKFEIRDELSVVLIVEWVVELCVKVDLN